MSAKNRTLSRRSFMGATAGALLAATAKAAPEQNSLVINAGMGAETISRHIYGHFAEHLGSCIYGGIWVGEDSPIPNVRGIRKDTVAALKKLNIPNLRWPGGCFADTYHWHDGIGPRQKRPAMLNSHWGGVVENNHFGTHEFMDLCEQLDTEPYVAGNLGSGTVQEMSDWVQYLNAASGPMAELRKKNGREAPWKVSYFGVGNENWGCGGNMTPEHYADLYKQFATYLHDWNGTRLYRVACGASDSNFNWTEVLMKNAGSRMQGLSLHYYTTNWRDKGSATEFGEEKWFSQLQRTLEMETLVMRHSEIMDRYDERKRVGLMVDEWGAWYNTEPGTNPSFLYQQNTLRDALIAGINLNIFNAHCGRVKMANIAQTVNVLQAMVLTQDEKMLVTPSYHVFEMYKVHQDATLLPLVLKCGEYRYRDGGIPALHASASRDKNGTIHVSVCNLDPNNAQDLKCSLAGAQAARIKGRILSAPEMSAHNTFDEPESVKPARFDGAKIEADGFSATLPPKSVVVLALEG